MKRARTALTRRGGELLVEFFRAFERGRSDLYHPEFVVRRENQILHPTYPIVGVGNLFSPVGHIRFTKSQVSHKSASFLSSQAATLKYLTN